MRKLLSLILYLFIGLPALLGTLFLIPARSWVLDRDFYKRIVSGPEIRAVLESPGIYAGFEGTLTAGENLVLSGPATGKALQKSLPVSEILSAAGKAVDSTFDSLEADPAAKAFRMDLAPLKASLEGSVPEFARVYAIEAPVSPSASAAALMVVPSAGAPLDLSARPSDLAEADFRRIVRTVLDSAVSSMPETVESDFSASGPSGKLGGKAVKPRDALNRGTLWLTFLAGGVWIACAFISSDSANKRLKWLGRTILLPGIVVLASGAVLRLAAEPLALSAVQDPELQRILADPSLAAVRDWIHKPFWIVSNGFLVSGSIAIILGGGISASRKALKYRDFE